LLHLCQTSGAKEAKESDIMTYTTRLSTSPRRKPLAAQSRPATLARSLARLEREHVALLLALSELDATSGSAAPDAALRAALAPLLRGDLRRTQYALSRADAGLYGVCDGCGHAIPARRLELNPALTRCAACDARAR
jgi:RNA polymerase-binding transcription factor DksA